MPLSWSCAFCRPASSAFSFLFLSSVSFCAYPGSLPPKQGELWASCDGDTASCVWFTVQRGDSCFHASFAALVAKSGWLGGCRRTGTYLGLQDQLPARCPDFVAGNDAPPPRTMLYGSLGPSWLLHLRSCAGSSAARETSWCDIQAGRLFPTPRFKTLSFRKSPSQYRCKP